MTHYILAKDAPDAPKGTRVELDGSYICPVDNDVYVFPTSILSNTEWFTPVEHEYKVGDWVMTNPVGISPSGNFGPAGGYGFIPNKLLKISSITLHSDDKVYWFEKHENGIFSGNFLPATAEQIRNANKVEIGGYTAEVGSNTVTFGCQTFNKSVLESLKDLYSRGSTIEFSCRIKDTTLTYETIDKILNQINVRNTEESE